MIAMRRKKRGLLEEVLMEFSLESLKKKSNGSNSVPIKDARVAVINFRINKSLADDILNSLVKKKKIKKNRRFIHL